MTSQDIQELHEDHVRDLVNFHCDFESIPESILPQWFRDDQRLSPFLCPRCHVSAKNASDTEMFCCQCGTRWTPNEVLRLREWLTEELELMFGEGI